MQEAIELQIKMCGSRPLGWYTGRTSENTRKLVAEEGGFLYDSDDYSDDLPFWSKVESKPHLIIPYTLICSSIKLFSQYPSLALNSLNCRDEMPPKLRIFP